MYKVGKLEFTSQSDYENYMNKKRIDTQIVKMKENLIWLAETYLELYKKIIYKRIDNQNELEDMYLSELFDYFDGYRESIKNELLEVYNGMIVLREYCNKCMSNLPRDIVILISHIEDLDIL